MKASNTKITPIFPEYAFAVIETTDGAKYVYKTNIYIDEIKSYTTHVADLSCDKISDENEEKFIRRAILNSCAYQTFYRPAGLENKSPSSFCAEPRDATDFILNNLGYIFRGIMEFQKR